jgi:hypothetical protein
LAARRVFFARALGAITFRHPLLLATGYKRAANPSGARALMTEDVRVRFILFSMLASIPAVP